jgi:transcriptional regulator with GAF, ATPase, and Fis domain
MPREKSPSVQASAKGVKDAFADVDLLNEQAWDLNRKDPKRSITLAEEALALSRETDYRKGCAYALRTIGACCIWLSRNEEAMERSVEAIALLKEVGDKKEEAQVTYNIGTNFYYMADYANALKYYIQCYRINAEINNLIGMADAHNGMGAVYYTTGENEKAIDSLNKALAMCEEVGDTLIRPKVLDGLGECYANLKQYDKSIECMFRSLEFTKMRTGTEQVQGFALNGIGRIYTIKGDLTRALLCFNESLAIRKKIGHKIGEVTTLTDIGKLHLKEGKNTRAIALLEKAINIAVRAKYKEGISAAAEVLAQACEKAGKTKKALEYYKKFHQVREEVLREKDTRKSRSLELQFKMEQMEKERELLHRKNEDLESFYKDVTLLSEIGQKIISSLSVEVIVETVYENVNAMMDAAGFGIGLLEDDGGTVNFPVYIEEGERLKDVRYNTSDKDRLTVWCLDHKKEIFINDFRKDVTQYIRQVQAPVAGRNVESILYMPLMVKDRILGVITVQSFSKNAYTPYHLNMLRNLAMYAAIALENASLYSNMEGEVKRRTHEAVEQKEEIERTYKNTQLLSEIGQQITSTLDFDTIFTKLYENVNKLMDAECFGVRIYHADKNTAEYKFEIENGQKYDPVEVPMTDENNYTVWCIKNRREIFLNDNLNEYQKYVKQIRVVSGEMPHSLLFSPMMLGDRLVGVITVQSFKKHAYSPYHLDILRTLGTYTAIALDNANLYENMEEKVKARTIEVVKQKEEIERTYENTRLLSTIGKDITATLSVNEIIEKVYSNVNTLMDASTFGIGIYKEDKKHILFPATMEKGEKLKAYTYSLNDTHRPAVRCYLNQEDFFINDFSSNYVKKDGKDYGAQVGELPESMIYVPVTLNEKRIGVITVQSFSSNAYTDYHLQILKNLAVYVAIALDNAGLYQNMEQRVKERTEEIEKNYQDTHLLSKIAKDISASLNVEAIISKVYENVNTLMDATCFGIGMYNAAKNTLDFPGFVEKSDILPNVSFNADDTNRLAVWCFRHEKEIFINDYSIEYTKYIKTAKAPVAGQDSSSIIYLPLYSQGKAIGAITVQSFERNAYTPYHLDMLRSLAVSVGIALDNAGLYQNLESKVKERTAEVIQQKEIIEQKNKEITDSINYAKNIQRAILPHSAFIHDLLPDSFGLYRPKDVVSGDFYWVGHQGGKVLVAAADCTGHGVPGAFMSMLASSKLDFAVNEKGMTRPADILKLLNVGIKSTLKQNIDGSLSRDGMDIALCCIDFDSNRLLFSGANRPLLHIRNGMLCEVPQTKSALGGLTPDEQEFLHEEIDIRKGDCIYIFTDGYADQFGGDQGKKFMTKRFKEMLLGIWDKPMKEQESILENTLEEWKSGREQVDDILVIGIRV